MIDRDALARNICARLCDERRTIDELRVVDDVLAGLEQGAESIGPLDLTSDDRDFDEEAAQECRDLLAYLAMRKVAAQHRKREQITAAHCGACAPGWSCWRGESACHKSTGPTLAECKARFEGEFGEAFPLPPPPIVSGPHALADFDETPTGERVFDVSDVETKR